jgi:probable HAF family extracellular repeat protein
VSNDERALRPAESSSVARVGAPSWLITRGLARLQPRERRFMELPTPPHENNESWPSAMNNRGQIVGLVDWNTHVLWEQGRMVKLDMIMRNLETRPGWGFSISEMNDYGQIVGVEYDFSLHTPAKTILWDNGRRIELEGLESIPGIPLAINNRGQIIGYYRPDIGSLEDLKPGVWDSGLKAAVWDSGQVTILETLTDKSDDLEFGSDACACGINNHGVIVGGCGGVPVKWEAGHVTKLHLPVMGEHMGGSAHDINDHGEIVGRVSYRGEDDGLDDGINSTWESQVVIWKHEDCIPLHSVRETDISSLRINNRGQVVGFFVPTSEDLDRMHAYLWEDGRIVELDVPAEWGSWVNDINDTGHVIGGYSPADGEWSRACLWA